MANSVDPEQTAPIGAVCSGSTLFASMLNLSVMLGNYLQQTTSADDIFKCIFLIGTFWVKNQNGQFHTCNIVILHSYCIVHSKQFQAHQLSMKSFL